ncbi:hypothetical protein OS242_13300 [Tumebacillus sp. DT12]|uniref:Uncharacterized protein n=1 Tax=Tumebacillus lacus TaxID=2995335 RepID=A0ABT3X835_9BACL|nr:hypothetical protein [Tumebacillus lacus]MCX7570919.1 hypothetical protein [Tumebacillus lacus]
METERKARPVEKSTPVSKATSNVPAQAAGPLLSVAGLHRLQHTVGNRAVLQMMRDRRRAQMQPVQTEQRGQVLQGQFKYTNNIDLSRKNGKEEAQVSPGSLTVGALSLPASYRPPTQFGIEQKAHSISWTLLKQAYENVGNLDEKLTVEKFINEYLKKDWAALSEQKPLLEEDEDNETLTNAYAAFNRFLGEYPDSFFTELVTQSKSAADWSALVQKCVSDLFVATQLAPLTTHTGFTAVKGASSKGVQEHRPSNHGEGYANRKLRELEAELKQGKSVSGQTVEECAAMYWDPGSDREGGISDLKELQYLKAEFLKAFERAYPNIWKAHAADVKKVFTSVADKKPNAEADAEAEVEAAVKEEDEEKEEPGKQQFQALLQVEEKDTGGNLQRFPASEFDVDDLKLSNDRPPTKYGPIGQKSHTVSWSLVLQGLQKAASGKDLSQFLSSLLSRWTFLNDQDWEGMIDSELLNASDFKASTKPSTVQSAQKVNKTRLEQVQALIEPNLTRLNAALSGLCLTGLEWKNLLQTTISDYVVVYQSSPLASYKDGMPKGNGESDANKWLTHREYYLTHADDEKFDDEAKELMETQWEKKFKYEFDKKSRGGNPVRYQDKDSEEISKSKAVKNLIGKKGFTDDTQKDMDRLLVKQEALKHLDVSWNTFKSGRMTTADKMKYMSMVLYEWESAVAEAYPKVGESHGQELRDYSDLYAVSDTMNEDLIEQKVEEKRESLKDKMLEDGELEKELEQVRAEHEGKVFILSPIMDRTRNAYQNVAPDSASVQASPEYDKGLASARGGAREQNGSEAYKLAMQHYQSGMEKAQGEQAKPAEKAAAAGYDDYRRGVSIAQSDGALPAEAAAKTGFADYHSGIFDAQIQAAKGTGGRGVGYEDFMRGTQDRDQDPSGMVQEPDCYGYMAGFRRPQDGGARSTSPSPKKKIKQ